MQVYKIKLFSSPGSILEKSRGYTVYMSEHIEIHLCVRFLP